MPVFKTRKFAKGGGIKSLFNNPGFGLGLEYIPTAQELPDIEGTMYVEQAKNAARTQLEGLRKENTPDVTELLKGLDDLEMFTSVKDGFKREIQQDVQGFMAKMKSDPDFAFSMDARHEYNALQAKLTSSNYQSQALRYKEVEKDYSNAQSKGLGEEMYISNGMIPVMDVRNKKLQMMPISQAKELFENPETSSRYTTFGKSSQVYDYYHRFADKSTNDYLNFSGRSTVKDARAEMDSVFKNVASSMVDSITYDDIANKSGIAVYQQFKEKTQSNTAQLEQAAQQVIDTLSPQSLDALRGSYIQRSNDLSDEGFSKYVMSMITGEAQIRSATSRTTDSNVNVLSSDAREALNGKGEALHQPVETSESFSLRESNFFPDLWGKDMFIAPVVAKSSRPSNMQEPEEKRIFSGKMLVYNGDAFGNTGRNGGLENKSKTLHNVNYKGSFLLPISTGDVITVKPGQEPFLDREEDLAGKYFASKEGSDSFMGRFKMKNSTRHTINIGGQDYMAYESMEEGKFIVVSPKAFASYEGFEDPDSDKSHTVIFRPLDPTETTQDFSNPAFSIDYKYQNYFDENTNEVSTEGRDNLQVIFQSLDDRIDEVKSAQLSTLPKNQADQARTVLVQMEKQKEELTRKAEYIEAVKNGTVVLKTNADIQEFDLIRFQLNSLMNDVRNNKTIDTTRDITTTINNSIKASRTFNNLLR